ncbi:MAG: hypothetical protein ACP5TZ_05200, partial [Nitrososphaeria archaeon]
MENCVYHGMDIHNYRARMGYMLKTLDRSGIPEEDKELIKKYVKSLLSTNMSFGRVAKYIAGLKVIREHMNCNFADAGRAEIEGLMGWLNSTDYTPHTKMDYRGVVKRFYRWLRTGAVDNSQPFPPEVVWIKEGMKRNEMKEPDVLTEDEAMAMINAAVKM